MYNGREVLETDTAKSIGLKEGDNIDCFDRLSYLIMIYFVSSN